MYYFQCMEAHQLLIKVHHYYRFWRTSGPYQDIQWMWTNVSFVIFICESAIVWVIFIIRWWVRVSMWMSVHLLVFSDHLNVIRNTDHKHRTLLRLYIVVPQLSRCPRHKPSRELQRRTTGMTTELPGPQLHVSVQALVTLYILVYKINSCCLYIRCPFSLLCKLKLKQIKKNFLVWIQTISFLQS